MRAISASRVEAFAQGDQLFRGHAGAHLAGDRIGQRGEQRDVSTVQLAGAIADPRPVRAGEDQRTGGILAHQRDFVVEYEGLVTGPHRWIDARLPRSAVPAEMAHHRAGRAVAGQHALRIRSPACGIGLGAVDHVAAVDGEFEAVDPLRRLRTRLAELARHPPHADHRTVGDSLQSAREHVQQAGLAGGMGLGALRGVLRAVARLHDMGAFGGDDGQRRAKRAHVPGVHEPRGGQELPPHAPYTLRVAPLRLLPGRFRTDVEHRVVH
jgi:hypothetical protein